MLTPISGWTRSRLPGSGQFMHWEQQLEGWEPCCSMIRLDGNWASWCQQCHQAWGGSHSCQTVVVYKFKHSLKHVQIWDTCTEVSLRKCEKWTDNSWAVALKMHVKWQNTNINFVLKTKIKFIDLNKSIDEVWCLYDDFKYMHCVLDTCYLEELWTCGCSIWAVSSLVLPGGWQQHPFLYITVVTECFYRRVISSHKIHIFILFKRICKQPWKWICSIQCSYIK